MSSTMPPLPPNDPFATPCFYYGAVAVVWCWYEVEPELLEGYLDALGMKPGRFAGKGLVNFSFMSATSLFGSGSFASSHGPYNPGGSAFNETELNVVAYAKAREADVPEDLTAQDYLFGADQAKNLGVYRLHVACDNDNAIAAGKAYYYENKFKTFYQYTSPSPNRKVEDQIKTDDKWQILCTAADSADSAMIYKADIDATNLSMHDANASPIIDISYDKKSGRVLGSRRNFLGLHKVAMLNADCAWRVAFHPGATDSGLSDDAKQMRDDMKRLIGDRAPIAIQRFESPPCIAEAVPYYMD